MTQKFHPQQLLQDKEFHLLSAGTGLTPGPSDQGQFLKELHAFHSQGFVASSSMLCSGKRSALPRVHTALLSQHRKLARWTTGWMKKEDMGVCHTRRRYTLYPPTHQEYWSTCSYTDLVKNTLQQCMTSQLEHACTGREVQLSFSNSLSCRNLIQLSTMLKSLPQTYPGQEKGENHW